MNSENFADYLEDFEFKSLDELMTEAWECRLGDISDQAYEEYRDRRCGL